MKRIIVLGLMISILLTGCGVPDRVKEEMDKVKVEARFDKKFYNELKTNAASAATKNNKVANSYRFSEEKKQQILQLYALITEKEEKKLLKEYYEYNELDSEGGYVELEKPGKELEKYLNQETYEINSMYTISFRMKKEKEFINLLQELTKLGYTELENCIPKDESTSDYDVISQGIKFNIYKVFNEDIFFMDISIKGTEVPSIPQFDTEMQKSLGEVFWNNSINVGGDIDCYVYTGSMNEKNNSYQKSIYIYVKDEKIIQMEIAVEGERKASQPYFSTQEQEALKKILAAMSQDEKAAETFLASVSADSPDKGEFGTCKWYRINQIYGGCTLRILEGE